MNQEKKSKNQNDSENRPILNERYFECNDKPDCKCQECEMDRWGDTQIEEYGEANIETSRGL